MLTKEKRYINRNRSWKNGTSFIIIEENLGSLKSHTHKTLRGRGEGGYPSSPGWLSAPPITPPATPDAPSPYAPVYSADTQAQY
jgi:hypothetical protein